MVQGMHLTPLGDGSVLLEPGEGLDPADPDAYLEPLVGFLQGQAANRLIYDLGEVGVIDELYYDWLVRLSRACRVTGVQVVAANIHPPAAFALAQRLTADPPFDCALDVDRARGLTPRSGP